MIDFNLADVNYLAVLVAAVAAFVLGGIWYAALFAKPWIALHGYTAEEQKEMDANPARTFPLLFVTDLVLALGVAIVLNNVGIESVSMTTGISVGALLWFAVAMPIGLAVFVATWTSKRNIGGWVIDTAYQLFVLVLVGAILGAWR